jgi:hypothetical protein
LSRFAALAKLRPRKDKGRATAMAESGDMKAHEATYRSILSLFRWGAVFCFIIAFIIIWLIH